MSPVIEHFSDAALSPPVRGFLHRPPGPARGAFVLTHGAGGDSRAPVLVALAEALVARDYAVLRCDLPYRQQRASGPPRPGDAAHDRDGLRNALTALRRLAKGPAFLGGHSYGGRQSTILCAAEPGLVDGLLLLSYPLHPPRKPTQLRTQHLPDLRTPALFVHGTRDLFGNIEEMEAALRLIPGKTRLMVLGGAEHDLGFRKQGQAAKLAEEIAATAIAFLNE